MHYQHRNKKDPIILKPAWNMRKNCEQKTLAYVAGDFGDCSVSLSI